MTAPAPVDPGPRKAAPTLVVSVCMTVVVVALLGTYVLLTVTHHDAGPILPVIVAILGAGIPGVAALGKTQETAERVSVVQHQTNGNMSRLLDIAEKVVGSQINATLTAHQTAQQALAVVAPEQAPVQVDQVAPDAGPPPSVSPPPTAR